MRIIEAAVWGMCFGVRDALAAAERIAEPGRVIIHGELVHNPVVNRALAARGFVVGGERVGLTIRGENGSNAEMQRGRGPQREETRDTVMITAHGVSDRERGRLAAEGKKIVDTTCPLVRRAHEAALKLAREGFHVVVIGKKGHVEVEGLVGDLASFDVVGSAAEVRRFGKERLGVICQTTSVVEEVRAVVAAIVEANPGAEVKYVDTVCQPTKDRQAAIDALVAVVEVVVIVGGRHSNNTRKLVERVEGAGRRAIHVEGPAELCISDFIGVGHVGLTAGTSTLPETVLAVKRRLEEMGRLGRKVA